jgi:hyaluronate lyase
LSAEQTAAYAASPHFRILLNTAEAHAVEETTLGLRAATFWTAAEQTAGGISSNGVASVLVREAGGVLHVGVADPTQANDAGLRIGIDRAAVEVIEKDSAVVVERLSPDVVLQVNTRNRRGRTIEIRLRTPRPLPQRRRR